MVSVLSTLFQVLLLFLSFIMIVLVLLQRGRGGGLAGAFGGMGGQSAFGTKAGDVFTRITIVVAILWVLSAGLMGLTARASQNAGSRSNLPSAADASASGGDSEAMGKPKDDAAPRIPAESTAPESGSTAPVGTTPALPAPPSSTPANPAPPANQSTTDANKTPAPKAPVDEAAKAAPPATPPAAPAATTTEPAKAAETPKAP